MTPVGIYFAAVQFCFVSCWTVYVLFLPQLAAQVGIEKKWVIFILMADQVVFAVMDYLLGVAADRVLRALGRLGPLLLWTTAISCGAFLLLPFIAQTASQGLFFVVVAIWAMTSSALRAPPLVMLGKYAPPREVPWLSTLMLVGVGVAGAVAPYLTVSLRGVDARLPFALSSLALIAAVSGMLWAERHLAREAAAAPSAPAAKKPLNASVILFFAAVALLGLGFQAHFPLNSAALYLRHATPAELDTLMPVFWVGFNLLIFPACLANGRFGATGVMAAGAVAAALASSLAADAPSLGELLILQFIAGGAWAAVLMSAMTAAVAVGHVGREGAATGGLFSLLALAGFARMALVATQLDRDPAISALLVWVPGMFWAAAGLLLAWIVLRERLVRPAGDGQVQ